MPVYYSLHFTHNQQKCKVNLTKVGSTKKGKPNKQSSAFLICQKATLEKSWNLVGNSDGIFFEIRGKV